MIVSINMQTYMENMENSDEMVSYDTVQVFHELSFDSAVGRNGFRSI